MTRRACARCTRPSITCEQHCVHLAAQLFDAVDDLDLPLVSQFGGELIDTRAACFDVGTPAFVSRDYASARHVIRRSGVIQNFSKGRSVRSIGPNYPEPKIRCRQRRCSVRRTVRGFSSRVIVH